MTRYSESESNTFLGISKKSLYASRSLSKLIWREKPSGTPKWPCSRRKEKGRENQSKSFHTMISVEKPRPLLAYL
jgi:hypothetical protein